MKIKNYQKYYPLISILVLLLSCSKIDKDKFANLYQTTNDIEGAIKVGINYIDYSRLLQKVSSEKGLIDTTRLNDDEKKLYRLFDKLFIVYSHSHIIWNLDTENTFEYLPNFPREYIYYVKYPTYENAKILESLVQLYDLEIEEASFRDSVFPDVIAKRDAVNRNRAINKIWLKSSQIFSEIKKIYNE